MAVLLAAALASPARAEAPTLSGRVAEIEAKLDSLDVWMTECIAKIIPVRFGRDQRLVRAHRGNTQFHLVTTKPICVKGHAG